MEQNTIDVIFYIVSWLKSHYCWYNVSFWDFAVALFFISTFCRIVFHNYETVDIDVDVEGRQAYFTRNYH